MWVYFFCGDCFLGFYVCVGGGRVDVFGVGIELFCGVVFNSNKVAVWGFFFRVCRRSCEEFFFGVLSW